MQVQQKRTDDQESLTAPGNPLSICDFCCMDFDGGTAALHRSVAPRFLNTAEFSTYIIERLLGCKRRHSGNFHEANIKSPRLRTQQ